MHNYINEIIFLYVMKRQDMKVALDYPVLLLFDNFKGQCLEKILRYVDSYDSYTVLMRIKAGLKYTQGLKYTPGNAAEWKK